MKDDWTNVSEKMRDYGVVNGYINGYFGANDFLNRGQMAAFLINTKIGLREIIMNGRG